MVIMHFEPENNRSAAYDAGKKIGECVFSREGDTWVIEHTEVDPAYGGQNLAGRLLKTVLDNALFAHAHVHPVCSYAVHAFETHPEYQKYL